MRVAIANQKGGVGKTTTAVNLSAALAKAGHSVLLVDMDPQGNASTGLGLQASDRTTTSYDLLAGRGGFGGPRQTPLPNLQIIPSAPDLAGSDLEFAVSPARERLLLNGLQEWLEVSVPPEYIIFDCPPSLGLVTLNALVAATTVLVPMQCEFYALEGLAHLVGTLDRVREKMNASLKMDGIVLTMYDRRNNLSELVAADVRSFFGSAVFDTVIPRNIRVSEAPSHGQPITTYDPRSPGALAYIRLAAEFVARHGRARS